MLRLYRYLHAGRADAGRVHRLCLQPRDVSVLRVDAAHAQVVHERGLRGQRSGDGADQQRLLGVDRAAVAAVAAVPAAAHVARNHMPFPAELLASRLEHGVVGVGRRGPGSDPEAFTAFIEPGFGLLDAPALHAVCLGPVLQRLGRGAKAGGPVDGRGAADRTALQDSDRTIFRGTPGRLLIERRVGTRLVHVLEVLRGLQGAFLDQKHFQTCGAEDLRRRAAARAAADDGDIAFECLWRRERGRVAHVPATRDAVGVEVVDRHQPAPVARSLTAAYIGAQGPG